MAIFNPAVPDAPAPNYFGYSKPIEQPSADLTTSTAIKGIADIGGNVIKATDTIVKSGIDDQLHAGVDKEQDAYMNTLQVAKTNGVPKVTDATSDTDPNTVPTDLQNLDDTVDQLTGAKKYGNTYYRGRLVQLQKELRSQYPGYREYIDQKMSEITGGNQANLYMAAVQADIAAASSAGNKEVNQTVALLTRPESLGIPGIEKKIAEAKAGTLTLAQAVAWVAPTSQLDLQMKQNAYKRTLQANAREDNSRSVLDDFTAKGNDMATNDFKALVDQMGITPEKMETFQARQDNGGIPLVSPEEAQFAGQRFKQAKVIAAQHLWEAATKVDPSSKRSALMDSGMSGADFKTKVIEPSLAMYDMQADLFLNKEYGKAYEATNMATALQSSNKLGVLKDAKLGEYMLTMKTFNDQLGPNALASTFTKYYAGKDLPKDTVEYLKNKSRIAAIGSNPADPTTAPTLAGDVSDGKKKNLTQGGVYDSYIHNVEGIVDPKLNDKTKTNLAKYAFLPQNQGVLSQFAKENIDPQSGKPIPGQLDIFKRMTSPAMTSEIVRLSQQDPTILANYTDWVKNTFGHELLNRHLNDLQNLQGNSDLKLSWDDTNNALVVKRSDENKAKSKDLLNSAGFIDDAVLNNARTIVNKINYGLDSVKNLAKATKDPDGVDAYMIRTLKEIGVDPKIGNGISIPQRVMNAIAFSHRFNNSFDSSK